MARKTSTDHYKEILNAVRDDGQRKPVYYLYGEESFYLDLLQVKFTRLLPSELQDFNLDLLYGSETDPQRVLDIARSYPMMAPFRIIIVRDFSKLFRQGAGQDAAEDFLSYLESPNPSALLLLMDQKPLHKGSRLGKRLAGGKSSHVYSQKFSRLPDHKLPEWVIDWVAYSWKKSIHPEAAQVLAHLVGNDLQLMSTEIDKVCTFVDSQQEITLEHIKATTSLYREYSVFELKEAVFARQHERALTIMEQMLHKSDTETGEVIRVVGFFYSVFGNIWQIRRLVEKGMSKSLVQQEMGISSSWYFNQLWNDASSFHLSDMPRIFEALLDSDRAIKGYSTLDAPTILLLLIKRMIG